MRNELNTLPSGRRSKVRRKGLQIAKKEERRSTNADAKQRGKDAKSAEIAETPLVFIRQGGQSPPRRSSHGNRPGIKRGAEQDLFQSEITVLPAKLELRVVTKLMVPYLAKKCPSA